VPAKEEITQWFQQLQDEICAAIEKTDSQGKFQQDLWSREGGGGGRSRIMNNGRIIEKGGVNFSAVHGELPDQVKSVLQFEGTANFFATGVSIVMHPHNPFVPIIHMNVRYFEMSDGRKWFGGGIDLTPHYINEEDARFFHQNLKTTCDQFNPQYYPDFKKWADDYFFITHRTETRGVGGIFFDRLIEKEGFSFDDRWSFVKAVGSTFAPVYTELMRRNFEKPFTQQNKDWQLIRRGRYVEFNLVYDKGTKFGLETNGRIESILMSLPPLAAWPYDHQPEEGSPEKQTLQLLKKDIDWM
jgi:coproporphyrinogen III oxidase